MKKIPTLFKREFQDHNVISISPELSNPDLVWVLAGEGLATEKIDGACCAIIDGRFYKRYDAKKNKKGVMKTPPANAIPCDDPDPVTGHWPHWLPIGENAPSDHWFIAAMQNTPGELADGTYEAVGPHFNSNPHRLEQDVLVRHGEKVIDLAERSFECIREYLATHNIEGIVFWKDGEPRCKIKRKDFGLKWPADETMNKSEMTKRICESLLNPIDAPDFELASPVRAAVYMRVEYSTPCCVTTDEHLREYWRKWVSERSGWHIVDFYVDEGLTDTEWSPELARLMDDCRNGKIDVVLTRTIRHIGINTAHRMQLLTELSRLSNPIGVFFEYEGLFTLSPEKLYASAEDSLVL